MVESDSSERTIGLVGATAVGVGAIVGGGILALAGVAYASSGPSAIIAFALNGAVAFITAMSFAEVSSAFPESGGPYTFAKKVLSVRSAFAVGWVLWFAYIVAGVLYALGFASFAVLAAKSIWIGFGAEVPLWLTSRRMLLLLASGATATYALALIRKSTGGGQWETAGKVVVFAILIAVGLFALARQPIEQTRAALDPFMPGGAAGVFSAMGFTFIALQGFDLVSAVAGEVKRPARNIPRAMFVSLSIAMVIYLPLLFIVATVGVAPGERIAALARAEPEAVIAIAARRYMGDIGYWLVIIAALLSMLSALQANILAASRVALSMARDRTLPIVLSRLHPQRGTPVMAVYATGLTLVAIVFMIPDLAAAGAAASLIFLISFALTHVNTYLARVRGGIGADAYHSPWFPLVPVVGGLACAALAVFQAVVVPDAAGIVVMWVGFGVILYFALFARAARTTDAAAEAFDPTLVRLRGHNPLVLVPLANPARAQGTVQVAHALAPPSVGRVLVLAIVRARDAEEAVAQLPVAQDVVRAALASSYAGGGQPEALITASAEPLEEIARVADEHGCESVLLGLSDVAAEASDRELEELINDLGRDVAIMRAPQGWNLDEAKRILVPIGGRGGQDELRARFLGSLCRTSPRDVTFLRIVADDATEETVIAAQRVAERIGQRQLAGATVVVVRAADPAEAILRAAEDADLVILGLAQTGMRRFGLGELSVPISWEAPRTVFGALPLAVARRARCATVLLGSRL